MNRLRLIFLSLGLSLLVRGQEIGNYVNNGSFESIPSCSVGAMSDCYFWNAIDSVDWWQTGALRVTCGGTSPIGPASGFQYPRSGGNYGEITPYCKNCGVNNQRYMPKNRLKSPLLNGRSYCVQMWVSLREASAVAIDALQILLADNSVDTITYGAVPLTYLSPQISHTVGNPISDTLNWVAIKGTFTANGTEKYLILGNFKSDSITALTAVINSTIGFQDWSEYWVDDVSVIEINLPAYAGPDKSCILGDSAFIGREPDFAIDPGCIWYKLPNMTTPIDTISGLWVKPTTTSTYVVRQELDCSPLKWDTVVVFMDAVGLKDLSWYSDNINLFPNPTETDLTITFANQADISKISIINSLGHTIREEDLHLQKAVFSVSTSGLDKGIYLIQFKTSAGTVTKQFVKN